MEYGQDTKTVSEKNRCSFDDAKQIGDALGIPWAKFSLEQFTMGLSVELERARRDQATEVTRDEPILSGMIALSNLNEDPDYYSQLTEIEQETIQLKKPQGNGSMWSRPSPERNIEGKMLSIVVYTLMFGLKVWHASRPTTSTTAGLRHGLHLRSKLH